MRLIIITVLMYFSICSPIFATETVSEVGEYSLCVISANDMSSQNGLLVDFDININLKQGTDFAFIPLPVRNSKDFRMIIEPTSDTNIVSFGFIRPTEEFSLCIAKLNAVKKTNLRIIFKNVLLPTHPSARSDSEMAIILLLEEAYKKILAEKIPLASIPTLTNIFIEFKSFQDSNPLSIVTNSYMRRSISKEGLSDIPKNITVFISTKQNEIFLYWILGFMGILLGYFGAPKVVTSPQRAKFFLIVGIVVAVCLVGFFFGYLTEQQRINDTTTIVTFGSSFGLLIGLLILSIQYLFKVRTGEIVQAQPGH